MTGHRNQASLSLLSGRPWQELIESAISTRSNEIPHNVTVANNSLAGTPGFSLSRIVIDVLLALGSIGEQLDPPASTIRALLGGRRVDWTDIDVSARASRLSIVRLPSLLAHGSTVFLAGALPNGTSLNDPIAIGAWARYAHVRQRIGAAISDPRDGLTAEIALAVRPSLIILGGTWRGLDVIVATDDQIAAELAGLAFRQSIAPGDDEPIGPWEHPLVQRATELHLGALTPSAIKGRAEWIGDEETTAHSEFKVFAADVFGRIGINIEA